MVFKVEGASAVEGLPKTLALVVESDLDVKPSPKLDIAKRLLTLETSWREDEAALVVVMVVVEAVAEVPKSVPVLPSASLEEAKRLLTPPPFVEVLPNSPPACPVGAVES